MVKLPVKSIWITKYLDFKREFENIFNIYISYRYEPYSLQIQSNKFHEGMYDVRFQMQIFCTQYILVLLSTYFLLTTKHRFRR